MFSTRRLYDALYAYIKLLRMFEDGGVVRLLTTQRQ